MLPTMKVLYYKQKVIVLYYKQKHWTAGYKCQYYRSQDESSFSVPLALSELHYLVDCSESPVLQYF